MVTLTLDVVAESAGKRTPPSSVTDLSLRGKDFHEIVPLDALTSLVRLDLSQNRLTNIEELSCCKSLKWLSVAQNELKSLRGVQSLSHLSVLNASRNQIDSMKEVKNLSNLCALILNDNHIHSICKLKSLKSLNTLVLSRNPISNTGTSLQHLSSLEKVPAFELVHAMSSVQTGGDQLSLSDCQLHDLEWAKGLVGLKELRLSHNIITDLPDFLGGLRLQILDLGNNCLKKFSKINVLCSITGLRNLNLRGNPIALKQTYDDEIKKLLPHLSILDGHSLQRDIKESNFKRELSTETKMLTKIRNIQKSGHVDQKNYTRSESNEKDERKTISDTTGNNMEDKPFIALIMQKESTVKQEDGKEKMKPTEDSGIVSITNRRKSLKRGRDAQNCDRSSAFFIPAEMNIGIGGPSQWEA